MKECTTCKETKPYDMFYNYKASKDGKSYRCKVCDYAQRNAYHKKHYTSVREKLRVNQRKSKYGLSQADFDKLFGLQKGCCAICGVELDEGFGRHHKPNKLVVDHCHGTGKVRGLLCTMCNKGIGLLKDNPTIVEKALQYLKTDIH